MLTYIYLVKCPHCEDEYFDFFDEAKQYALERISKQPIITQTEVTRNDFGECTDHCDLGTVWSWEEAIGDDCKADDSCSHVLCKADLDGIDSEFDELDNSVDYEIDEVSETQQISESSIQDATREPKDSDWVIVCRMPTTQRHSFLSRDYTINPDLSLAMTYPGKFSAQDEIKYAADALAKRGTKFRKSSDPIDWHGYDYYEFRKHPMRYYDDNLTANFFVTTVAEAKKLQLATETKTQHRARVANMESKPIPEGMTIEELVEAMEENEDTVECAVCEELFPKTDGVKRGHSYVCPTCSKTNVDLAIANLVVDEFEAIDGYDDAEAVVANSDLPEDKQAEILDVIDHIREEEEEHIDELKELKTEDNTLSEDLDDTRSLEELVKDSINHLTNDLGKDPWADDFADDVIADLENNYDIYVPEDMAKYGNWCHSVASEVSKQVNRSEHSFLEELEEPEAYRERLCLCPECGTDKTFDKETGFCIECGFML